MKPENRQIEILLVEDDEADILLTKRVMSKSKLHLSISVAPDGVQAMRFLRQEPPFEDAPTPDLVLLDLNLPKMSGLEVLKEIRDDDRLAHLPIVVLTTSQADEDIARSYKHNVNCYITKPVDLKQFTKVVHSIEEFWLTIVKLPHKS